MTTDMFFSSLSENEFGELTLILPSRMEDAIEYLDIIHDKMCIYI